ncbi:phosphatidylinositol mannoside acyltransferase, partial [Bacillus paralicheniformis]|nr:phosphatidylinositol mannoside acyltransferase [Bacillus paralicheniformis]
MKERLVDAAYGAGWGLVKVVPEFVARPAFQAGADVAALRNGSGAQPLRRHLTRVVPGATSK